MKGLKNEKLVIKQFMVTLLLKKCLKIDGDIKKYVQCLKIVKMFNISVNFEDTCSKYCSNPNIC